MTQEYQQAFDGQRRLIEINRSRITLMRRPMKTDPITGGQIIDPFGVLTEHAIYCRITHERSIVAQNEPTPAGQSTNLQRMILTDNKNVPQEYDIFEWKNKVFEIGPVDPIIKFGGTVGYQAPLQEADTET